MVYFNMSGRLGNIMFQYATAASLGGKNVRGVLTSLQTKVAFERSKELFRDLILAPSPANIKVYREPRFRYDKIPCTGTDDILLSGNFQSEKYFNEPLVREMFKISEARRSILIEKYGEYLSRDNVTGISVRRGDYLRYPERFPFVGEKYFCDAIASIPKVDSYIVCSDDILWCRRFFPSRFPDKNFMFVENESILNQLYIHTLCMNNIMSNSSFSWWGAWLNENQEKIVIAPSMWFGMLFKQYGWDWSDIYMHGTRIIKTGYSPTMFLNAIRCWASWEVIKRISPYKQKLFKRLLGRTHFFAQKSLVDIDK